ncbi:MAG: HypC/HybG/HupF family hydrogenase formation chaperone [Fervidicoccus sp.]|nr:MAG: HypC/HybG/HupF family hydrogenase formation chaperone [Fervidicoccus sp.]
MCLGVPAKIVRIEGKDAIAEVGGIRREVSIELLNDVKEGDYVIIHAGFAISKLDEEEAEIMLDFLSNIPEE